jgi:16S rRNA (adenine1518-N6/adenine1519-N6)-dimethyltransferase
MTIDLTSPVQLKDLLWRYNLRPRKRFGQNFLVDRNVLDKILDALDVHEGDSVLEIGPGVGTLTQGLAQRGARVVAVELDRDMVNVLKETLADYPNVTVWSEDFIRLDLPQFLTEHFGESRVKAVGNLPYNITSPIIAKLFTAEKQLDRIVMMVQKEVAERIESSPGRKEYGSMSVFVQYHAEAEIIDLVPNTVFLPPPGVTSAIVRLIPRPAPVVVPSEELFFDVVHCSFGKRRKTLLNSLAECPTLGLSKDQIAAILREADIDPMRRAETLSLDDFASVARATHALRCKET